MQDSTWSFKNTNATHQLLLNHVPTAQHPLIAIAQGVRQSVGVLLEVPGVMLARKSSDPGERRDAVGPYEPPESLSTRHMFALVAVVGSLIMVLGLRSVPLLR